MLNLGTELGTEMAKRAIKRLASRRVDTAKPGKHADGDGLYLIVAPVGSRKWVLRFTWQGKAREMGLGKATGDNLARARQNAAEAVRKIEAGIDPIADKARLAGVPTFGEIADDLVASLSEGFRNKKHKAQWKSTLETYAADLRSLRVDSVDTAHVLHALKPIWTAKPETASRVRGRIEKVLDAAKAKGHRTGENPARWRGHLDHLLPKQSKLSRGHHAAMPYADVPAFMEALRERDAMAALALEFCILTATRSGETLGARWSKIDMDAGVWTIPADRMKAGREHRVPLSKRALAVLVKAGEARDGDFVFPGQKRNSPLSAMALEMILRRMKIENATVHGFRSSFRDWAGNETLFPRDVAEQALAHVIGDKAEQAYRRSDGLEKRRLLMAAWAQFVDRTPSHKVVTLSSRLAG